MNKNKFSFVSTKGRSFNLDLQVVKNYLRSAMPDAEFEYYLYKSSTKISAINKKMNEGRRLFCADASNIICMDASIPIKMPSATEDQTRLFLAAPFDYQFNIFLKSSEADFQKKKTFIRCTDVIPGSPFTSKLLKNCYEWEDNVTFWDDIPHPASWDILQKEKQLAARKRIEFYYPQIKGKKILSLILDGKPQSTADNTEIPNPFQDFNLKEFIDKLGEDWFLITNNSYIIEIANQLPYTCSSAFGYTKNIVTVNDLLYASDMLVTNVSKHACLFSITQKPVYYLDYLQKYFGKYMKQFYSELYLENIHALLNIPFEREHLSKEQENFYHEFSYSPEKNPFETIRKIFKF